MNECMSVFLKIDRKDSYKNELLIQKIDELLLNFGIRYLGFGNMYRPEEPRNRDQAVYAAQSALRNAVWLKDKLDRICIMNQTEACSMDQIRTDHMSEPRPEKMDYYEEYFQTSHELAHGIVVDEEGQLRDGYTSYILAKKYGIRPDIYEAFAEEPLRKIVRGRHVVREGDTWKIICNRIYSWVYLLKKPVVPGDILKVPAKKGWAYICTDRIQYVTGTGFCKEHLTVRRHMGERISL